MKTNIYSPYYNIKSSWYTGYYKHVPFVKDETDLYYTIPTQYNEQPWRLAKELYNEERLYYIFTLLNPDLLVDPIYDFKAGTVIRIPTVERVDDFLRRKTY